MKRHNFKSVLLGFLIIISFVLAVYLALIFIFKAAPAKPGKAVFLEALQLVKSFPFTEENALKEWEEKIFKGKVIYKVEKDKDLSYVRAKSDGAASALYYKVKMDAKKMRPVIRWKWKVNAFPVKTRAESLEVENEDDFAARVYVIFPTAFLLNSRVLEYVWTRDIPPGTIGTSPYSSNIKLMALRRGQDDKGEWLLEERDIVADYNKMFGKDPDYNIGAIAFMTNAEHTGSSAEAMYDEIELGYK